MYTNVTTSQVPPPPRFSSLTFNITTFLFIATIVLFFSASLLAQTTTSDWNSWNGGTLELKDNVTLYDTTSGATSYERREISGVSSIVGNGYTIDGNGGTSTTNIQGGIISYTGTDSYNLTIDNVTIKNGAVKDTFDLGTGSEKYPRYYNGSAIYWNKGGIFMSNSTFNANNLSINVTDGGDYRALYVYGGAIYTTGSVTLSGENTFSNNTIITTGTGDAYSYGCAIYAKSIYIQSGKNTFSGNSSINNGGAIYGDVTINGGTNIFSGNSASTSGAIDGDLTIDGGTNTFSGNSAITSGAIYGDVTINGGTNTFSGNSASSSGGVFFAADFAIEGGINTFSGNSASEGSVLYGGSNHNITISGGTNTFSGNSDRLSSGSAPIEVKQKTQRKENNIGIKFSGANTKVTFWGNTSGSYNRDIYWEVKASNKKYIYAPTFTIQDSGEYYFGGGIVTSVVDDYKVGISADLVISKGTTETGPTVTFGPGSQTSIEGGKFSFSDTNLTIELGTAPESLKEINPKVNTTTPTSFYADSIEAGSGNTITVKADMVRGDKYTVFSTKSGISGIDVDTITWDINASEYLYRMENEGKNLVVLSPLVYDAYGASQLDKDVSIYDVYTNNPSASTNQSLTLLGDSAETKTTVLNNDTTTKESTLSVQSDTSEVRTVTSPSETTPTFQNTTGTTRLIAENIEFAGYTLDATGQEVHLSGKNITMNHCLSSLVEADAVLVANEFYLDSAEVTFGSKLKVDKMIIDSASKMTVGTDSTQADIMTVTGDFTANGSVINLDIFSTDSLDKISVGKSATLNGAVVFNINVADLYPIDTTFDLLTSTNGVTTDLNSLKAILSSGQYAEFILTNSDKTLTLVLKDQPEKPVPEPSTWVLLVLGTAGLVWLRRGKK